MKNKNFEFKWGINIIKSYKRLLLISILTSILMILYSLLKVLFIQTIVNISLQYNERYLSEIIIIICILIFCGTFVRFIQVKTSGTFSVEVSRKLRENIIERINNMSFEENNKNNLISILLNECSDIEKFLNEDFINVVSQPILMIAGCVYMCLINWRLALVSFILIPISTYFINKISRNVTMLSKKQFEYTGKYNTVFQDTIKGIIEVKSLNIEKLLYKKYENYINKSFDSSIKIEKINMLMLPFSILMYESPFVVCIVYGGYLSINGYIEPSELIAFIQLLSILVQPIVNLPILLSSIRKIVGAIKRVHLINNLKTERSDGQNFNIADCDKVVEFKNVSFEYSNGKKILDNVSCTFLKGQKVAIVGESGSGKSSILNLICGFYKPKQGDVYFYNNNVAKWNLDSLRKNITYVPQESYIFSGTIMENIKCGKDYVADEEIYSKIKSINADKFALDRKDKLNSLIGDGYCELSGGEKQKLCIIRALLNRSSIILLDEPTSAQDYYSETLIMNLLEKEEKDKTIICVAHRLWTLKNFDLIIVLKNGKIIEAGNHNSLMKNQGEYYSMFMKLGKDNKDVYTKKFS